MSKDKITFSFGENWKIFLDTVEQEEINKAKDDIEQWLGKDFVYGKTVVDIGSGSGIHSLAFYLLGAKKVYSFDFDSSSVYATKKLWKKIDEPENWSVYHGSILDKDFVQSIGTFDIVYSWGVLHHTGEMWKALDNSVELLNNTAKLWIALYAKGPRFKKDIKLKQKYNSASKFGKQVMIYKGITKYMLARIKHFKNPFAWNQKTGRGMNVYHDLIDWLGGLPYEVASVDEISEFAKKHELYIENIEERNEGACSIYVLSHINNKSN